jgi:hypothetical protein
MANAGLMPDPDKCPNCGYVVPAGRRVSLYLPGLLIAKLEKTFPTRTINSELIQEALKAYCEVVAEL